MTRIYTGRYAVQILPEATELSLLQKIPTTPSTAQTQLNEHQTFFSGSKVAMADSLTIHKCLEPSLKISGAIPPLNLSASMAHRGTTLFYLSQ